MVGKMMHANAYFDCPGAMGSGAMVPVTMDHTCVWLSAAVEKVCDFFVGMVVFLRTGGAS